MRIQLASRPGVLPDYDRALLLRELRLFPDWYIAKQLRIDAVAAAVRQSSTQVFELILANNLAQPRVYVHRDYHSRNLMVTEPNPGILDFQDAVYGPITYDLVSLFKDAYVRWDEERVIDWVVRYWEKARRRACRCMPTSARSTAISNGWACSGTSRCWASSPACFTATARTAICRTCPW